MIRDFIQHGMNVTMGSFAVVSGVGVLRLLIPVR